MTPATPSSSRSRARPRPGRRPPRSNRWWFKMAALSFITKCALLAALFFAARFVLTTAAPDDGAIPAEHR